MLCFCSFNCLTAILEPHHEKTGLLEDLGSRGVELCRENKGSCLHLRFCIYTKSMFSHEAAHLVVCYENKSNSCMCP